MNQTPEQIARDKIDQMLENSGWLVQSKDHVNLSAGIGVALRETNTESGSADFARPQVRRQSSRERPVLAAR